jgi:hypothetical protein
MIYNVLKHILKCFDFRSESISIIHWDIDALRIPALQKACEHNDRAVPQWNDSPDFSGDVDAIIASVPRSLTERQSGCWAFD